MLELLNYVAYSGSKYNYPTTRLAQPTTVGFTGSVWSIIAIVLAIVGALVIYFFFARQPRDKFKGFVTKLHDLVNFKRLRVEAILKICYLGLALFITLISFEFISFSFLTFFLTMVVGNLMLWVIFQFSMIAVKMYRNLAEISEKLDKK